MTTLNVNKHKVPTWEKQKENLKARFPALTDDDLKFQESDRYKMFDKLQEKLGWSPNELEVIALS